VRYRLDLLKTLGIAISMELYPIEKKTNGKRKKKHFLDITTNMDLISAIYGVGK